MKIVRFILECGIIILLIIARYLAAEGERPSPFMPPMQQEHRPLQRSLALHGVVVTEDVDDKASAALISDGLRTWIVGPGEFAGRYQVKEINKRSVLLIHGSDTLQLEI